MLEFELELSIGYEYSPDRRPAADFCLVEFVSSSFSLDPQKTEIIIDMADRRPLPPEPYKLRMMPVSLRAALEDLFREQSFTPHGDKSDGIKIFRVDAPESHGEDSIQVVDYDSDPVRFLRIHKSNAPITSVCCLF